MDNGKEADMHAGEILHRITKPLVLTGIYKDERSALIDIALDYIRRKIQRYTDTDLQYQKKYNCDFGHFTEQLQNRATIEAEEDWMAWKGAREMQQAWIDAKIKLSGNE